MDKHAIANIIRQCFKTEINFGEAQPLTVQDARLVLYKIKTFLVILASYGTMHGGGFDYNDAISYYSSVGLLGTNIRTLSESTKKSLIHLASGVSQTCAEIDTEPLSALHQVLTAEEVYFSGQSYFIDSSKNQRDVAGSYYTPPSLTQFVTERTFELYQAHCSPAPKEINVGDLSCGAGEFLCSAIPHLKDKTNSSTLWGYDVDPLALIVAHTRVRIAYKKEFGLSDNESLPFSFILGNPLLPYVDQANKASREAQEEAFAAGRLYSPIMRLSASDFPGQGFNIIVGNPPWEKIRFEEKKYLALYSTELAALNKSDRQIGLASTFTNDPRGIAKLHSIHANDYASFKRSLHCTTKHSLPGEPNSNTLFIETALEQRNTRCVIGQIVKSSLLTSPVNSMVTKRYISTGLIHEAHFYSNQNKIFPIDLREKFCLLFLGTGNSMQFDASFGNTKPVKIDTIPRTTIHARDLDIINPTTGLIPNLSKNEDYQFLLEQHGSHSIFAEVHPSCQYGRLVHLTAHSEHITQKDHPNSIGIYEGKFIGPHDMRYASFDKIDPEYRYAPKARARKLQEDEKIHNTPECRYFIDKARWEKISKNYSQNIMLCWRSLTSSTNSRTMIAALSEFRPASQSVQFLQHANVETLALLAGLFNSRIFDYLVRLKLPGIDLTQAVIKQIPVPSEEKYNETITFKQERMSIRSHITSRVAALYQNDETVKSTLASAGVRHARLSNRLDVLRELDELFYLAYELTDIKICKVEESFR